ncbi:MAG: FeoA family protein [Pseudomonadota bacterium]
MTLDLLPIGQRARIVAIDWTQLVAEEAQRLRALGIDEGARVAVEHRGVFAGRDPLAVSVGRMTVALRRVHAHAMEVEPIAAPAEVS